jgi:transcriptional regulator with XRE-family HTH domain
VVDENDMDGALQWDRVDRLHKSLRVSGVKVQAMADLLEVSRNTIGNWLSGRTKPSPSNMKIWAQKTGVRYEWLRDGKLPGEAGNDDQAELPPPERLRLMSAALQQIAERLEEDIGDG